LTKRYDAGSSLQAKVLAGVDKLADNVASTLGPRGRTFSWVSAPFTN